MVDKGQLKKKFLGEESKKKKREKRSLRAESRQDPLPQKGRTEAFK